MKFRRAYMQTLFKSSDALTYFEVQPAIVPVQGADTIDPPTAPPILEGLQCSEDTQVSLLRRLAEAQRETRSRYRTLDAPEHQSEVTPWLKTSGFHIHLQDLDLEDVPKSYALPQPDEDEEIQMVLESVQRVLEKAMFTLGHETDGHSVKVSRHNAKVINTFRSDEMNPDPMTRLQQPGSLTKYIQTWQKLVCYFMRIVEGSALRDDMFNATDGQIETLTAVIREVKRLRLQTIVTDQTIVPGPDPDAHTNRLDNLVRDFSMQLIQQPLRQRSFDSPVLSFLAALAWDGSAKTWRKVNNLNSFISQLIYDCQLMTLSHCLAVTANTGHRNLSEILTAFCREWTHNDTQTPMGELLALRLYAFQIGANTVNEAQIRWHRDGETLNYQNIRYSMTDLRTEIRHGIDAARHILETDLALGLGDLPTFNISSLADNWDTAGVGESFLTDARNQDELEDADRWLLTRLAGDPVQAALFFRESRPGDWRVISEAARQFEDAVQEFLGKLAVLIHKGSGQAARMTEFLGMRWCNNAYDKRNIFVHDGYLLFILTYHKSQSRTNASRWPVRFLLPEVGQLVLQYLAIVVPFRRFLSKEVQNPEEVSEYLFSRGSRVWQPAAMSQAMVRESSLVLGVKINVSAWRQISVGIALKKFGGVDASAGLKQDQDDEEGGTTQVSRGSMPDVFHYQASHTPHTGNQMYGGTVNFNQGITDAGLQEFHRASQRWHKLCLTRDEVAHGLPHHPLPTNIRGLDNRRQRSNTETELPLAKRIASNLVSTRHRRRWSLQDAQKVLLRLYGQDAQFKSSAQELLLETILQGHGQIIGILTTGAGKSLSFLLPSQLPHAGTTVVIFPLTALKYDQIRQCQDKQIPYHVWTSGSDAAQSGIPPLIFVSMEEATTKKFQQFLLKLDLGYLLDRVILDECHLVHTSASYRPKTRFLRELRELHCQFVCLSATFPPSLMGSFQQKLYLPNPQVIRTDTLRTDLQYRVMTVAPQQVQPMAIHQIKTFIQTQPHMVQDPKSRVIVYVATRHEADDYADALQGLRFYSDSGNESDKVAELRQWFQGASKVMVATSAFGAGVDYPHVRAVFHIGLPDSAIEFAQQVGRASRDGVWGLSLIIMSKRVPSQGSTDIDVGLSTDLQVMRAYAGEPRCRPAILSSYLDGRSWYCTFDPAPPCDQCRKFGRFEDALEEDASEFTAPAQESESSSESETGSDVEDLRAGATLLRRDVRAESQGMSRYVEGLRVLKGRCVLCWLDREGGGAADIHSGDYQHTLTDCKNQRKQRFFDAKRAAMRNTEANGRRQWIAQYAACFTCGNPQSVCSNQGRKGSVCEFRDIVFPAAWSAFLVPQWRRRDLPKIAGHAWSSEGHYMSWLGNLVTVYGTQASNAMKVTDWIIQQYL